MRAGRATRRAVLHDAWTDVIGHPTRAVLSSLGTVLGVTVLVATVGATESAAAHIVGIVDELAARQVQVYNARGATESDVAPERSFGFDAAERARRVEGVEAATTLTRMDDLSIASGAYQGRSAPADASVFAASAGFVEVVAAEVDGRTFGDDVGPTLPLALVGTDLADDLGLPDLARDPTVIVGDVTLRVIGIVTSVESRPDLLRSIVIPEEVAREELALRAPDSVLVSVSPNAAEVVAPQLPLALQPSGEGRFDVVRPPEPTVLRAGIADQTRGLLLALSGLCLALGAIGIANTTLVSVLERRPEIGLRRALGARRTDIVVHFLTESAIVGGLGAIMGAALGVIVGVVVARTQGWVPVLDPTWLLAAPGLGMGVGVIAGLYPALRSGAMAPIDALRASA